MDSSIDVGRNLFRLSVHALYCVLSTVIGVVQSVTWRWLGVTERIEKIRQGKLYEAQVLNVVARSKATTTESSARGNFIAIHDSFQHPSVVLQDNVSLFALTPTEAIFVETPFHLNIYSSKTNAFLYLAQYMYARRIVSLQLNVFSQIAKDIGNPKVPVIFVSHTTRCGSTMACQLAEHSGETQAPEGTGNGIALSQPDCFMNILDMLQEGLVTKEVAEILVCDSVRVLCKEMTSKPNTCMYLVKPRAPAIQWVPVLVEHMSFIKHVFLYRSGIKTCQSMEKIINSSCFLTTFIFAADKIPFIRCLIPDSIKYEFTRKFFSVLKDGEHSWANDLAFLRSLTKFEYACTYWCLACTEYLKLQRLKYNIAGIRYEDFLRSPSEAWNRILKHFDLSDSLKVGKGGEQILKSDSQAGTPFQKNKIAAYIAPESTVKTNSICDKFHVPRLDEECLLTGTITNGSFKN